MEETKDNAERNQDLILVPVDFTPASENAIRHGADLAIKLRGRICLLHVSPTQAGKSVAGNKIPQGDPCERLKALRTTYEALFPLKFGIAHKKGNILKTIVKTASDVQARMVVMGTHGKTGFQHLFGSYALKVVLDSPCPVLVVQDPPVDNPYRHIILPVSSELEARNSVEWAILIGKVYKSGVRLVLADEPDLTLKKRMEIIVSQITGMLEENNIPFEISLPDDSRDFTGRIISCASEGGPGLILAMTMPGTEMPGFSPSSWNERLMFNDDRVPVLCVNPSETGPFIAGWMNPD